MTSDASQTSLRAPAVAPKAAAPVSRAGNGAAPARKPDPAEKAVPAVAIAPRPEPTVDLRAPELYLNRELTWLEFNRRVLHEARDPRTPLLERVKFLAIVNSNLDEFFMKRIGGLKQQVGAGLHNLTVDGRTPEQQIAECVAVINELSLKLRDTYVELRARAPRARHRAVDLGAAVGRAARGRADLLSREHLPAGDAARDGPGAPVPVHLQPLAQPSGHAPPPGRPAAGVRAGQGAGRQGRAALPAGRRRATPSCRSRRSWRTAWTACSPAWRSTPASSSGSRATPTPSARRRMPTIWCR